MASFWFWLFAIILSFIGGAFITIVLYGLGVWIRDLYLKRGIPKNRKGVTDYIKDNPEKFEKTNPGKALELDKLEELQNDRKTNQRYREFEKLRREELKGRVGRKGQPNNVVPGVGQPTERAVLPNERNSGPQQPNPSGTGNRRKVRLDS